ncbi:hypothetical protein [Streptomyces chartreusis]
MVLPLPFGRWQRPRLSPHSLDTALARLANGAFEDDVAILTARLRDGNS